MDIKSKINSQEYLKRLVCSEERHDLSNFLYAAEDELRNGNLSPEDFVHFRSEYVLNEILSLKDNKKRDLQPAEILDKINYLSLIPDTVSLNNTFTDDRLIDGVINKDRDLSWWFDVGSLSNMPIETQVKVAQRLMMKGAIEEANKVLESINHSLEYMRSEEERSNFDSYSR